MASQTAEQTESVAWWRQITTELSRKIENLEKEMTDLLHERASLSLDAELQRSGAVGKLQKINGRLSSVEQGLANAQRALQQAEIELEKATDLEKLTAEERRHKAMCKCARQAFLTSVLFDKALMQVVREGQQVRSAIEELLALAKNGEERSMIKSCLERAIYQRAAESAGMRSVIEFPPHFGSDRDVIPLQEMLHTLLGYWLTEEPQSEESDIEITDFNNEEDREEEEEE